MKKVIITIIAIISVLSSFGQGAPVIDFSVLESLIANHKVQYDAFKKMKNDETKIAGLQKEITDKMAQIQVFKTKYYNSLKNFQVILQSSQDIVYANKLRQQITDNMTKATNIVVNHPEYLPFALDAQTKVLDKISNLIFYVVSVVGVGTDANLMNNADRLDVLRHVIKELRLLNTLSYNVLYILESAVRNGFWKTLVPGAFQPINHGQQYVNDIINNF